MTQYGLSQKYVIVFPNSWEQDLDDVMSDIDDCYDDLDINVKNYSVIISGETAESSVLSDVIDEEGVRNLILINPLPTQKVVNRVKNSKPETKIYFGLSIPSLQKSYNLDQISNFAVNLKKVMVENGLDTNLNYYQNTTDEQAYLPKLALDKFIPQIDKSTFS